jgi:putative ABC transport system permease protein
MKALMLRRRARNDLPQLATIALLVTASTAVGLLGPGLVLDTLDEGAREAVAAYGPPADVVATASIGAPGPEAQATSAASIINTASTISDGLPPGLASVYVGSTLSVISGETPVRDIDGEQWMGGGRLAVQLAMLTDENTAGLTIVDGRLPVVRAPDSLAPVEIVVSRATADMADLAVGQVLNLAVSDRQIFFSDNPVPEPVVIIVGVVDVIDATDNLWQESPEIWQPRHREASAAVGEQLRFTALAAPDGVQAASLFLDYPLNAFIRLRIDPERFSAATVAQIVDEASALRAGGLTLVPGAAIGVQTGIPEALVDYPKLAQAALAQMSVMMAGVIGIIAVVLILLSRLLVAQRGPAIALERARGASVLSIGLRALIESVAITAVAMAIGLLVSFISPIRDWLPVGVIAVVAVLATPVQTMTFARSLWTGRREPANRRDRQARTRRDRTRRAVIELAVIALAGAALVSLRGRGLLQNRTVGIDPFLAMAPLLLAIAVTIVVIRLYPYPVLLIGSRARRGRGALGLLGAVRARTSIAALPLLALTLGAALATSGTLIVNTVRDGQTEAGWQRIGADARITAALDPADLMALRSAPGVDAASATYVRGRVGLDFGTSGSSVTVIAIDSDYPDVVDSIPGAPSSASLRVLLEKPTSGDAVSIVVDEETARLIQKDDLAMYYGPAFIPLQVVGTTSISPDGYLEAPFAFVVYDAVAPYMPEEFEANSILVAGSGATPAVAALPQQDTVLTRSAWVADRRDLALISGVENAMLFATVAVALLAIVALVATVVAGARARGRALSLLRTLGMSSRLGWWLALAELAPLVLAAVLGGIAAGITVVLALAPSLGLDVLAGGTGVPDPSFSPTVFIGLAGAALLLLLLGTLADVLVHRRDKLSEVLRVGETV